MFGTAPTATQGGSIRFEEWKRQRVAVTTQWSRAGSSEFHPTVTVPNTARRANRKRGHRSTLANRCVADREVEWASTGATFPASVGTPQRECSATWVPHTNLCSGPRIRRQLRWVGGGSGALVLVDPPYEVESEFGEVRIECTPSSACAHALAAGAYARVPVIMGFAQ